MVSLYASAQKLWSFPVEGGPPTPPHYVHVAVRLRASGTWRRTNDRRWRASAGDGLKI